MKYILLIAITGLVLTAAMWALIPSRHLPRHRVRHLRIRLRLRLHPGRGHATAAELWLRWGRLAALHRSRRCRPAMTLLQRLTAPATAYSVTVGRGHYRRSLRLPLEEHAVVMSPPRAGKTGWLARIILRYPGPVLSTTTKHDVFQLTSGIRACRGPVLVFNPQGVGHVPSTFRWNPLDGCQDPQVAIRRADAFSHAVSMKGVEEGSFWSAKASDYMRAYLHAAAIAGLDFRHIVRWVMGIGSAEPEDILAAAPGPGRHWAQQLTELRGEANKTAQTIRMTMSRAVAFLTDPSLAACVLPEPGYGLDLQAFLRESGTLYLIAEAQGDDSPVAPLFACLANEVRHEAALLGSRMPGGRLDPPLLLALDEVTQICPVPVPAWLADSGGKGIQIVTVAHGEAQLRSRWATDGARVILDTSGAKIWLPGISDPGTLEMASTLCGTIAVREHGDYHDMRHPVMTPEMVRQLPDGHALVVRGGLSPVIARLPMAWKDPSYKRARRTGRSVAALAPVPPATTAPPLPRPRPGPRRPTPRPPAITGVRVGNGQQWPWQ